MLPLIVILCVLGFCALVFFVMYNGLVGKKNNCENAFAGIDVQLKKRYDLIPNLVASVKQYMSHEKDILEKVTELRSQALKPGVSSDEAVRLDNQMQGLLGGIMVAVENYPDLKANENVMQLQRSLNEIEAQLSASRRAFNAAVTEYNNGVEMFPTNIIAGMINYRRRELFVIAEEERQNVDVKNLFNS